MGEQPPISFSVSTQSLSNGGGATTQTFDKNEEEENTALRGGHPALDGRCVAVFKPYPVIDESRVHPSLRGLNDSTKCGWTSFGDGGSMVIHVERPDGSEVVLSLSNSLDHSFFERGQLYIGAMHFSMPGATKITGYDHTKFVVAKLLARDLPNDPGLREDIALMTKRIPDWISFMVEAGPSEAWDALRIP